VWDCVISCLSDTDKWRDNCLVDSYRILIGVCVSFDLAKHGFFRNFCFFSGFVLPCLSKMENSFLSINSLSLSTATTTEGSERNPLWVYRPSQLGGIVVDEKMHVVLSSHFVSNRNAFKKQQK